MGGAIGVLGLLVAVGGTFEACRLRPLHQPHPRPIQRSQVKGLPVHKTVETALVAAFQNEHLVDRHQGLVLAHQQAGQEPPKVTVAFWAEQVLKMRSVMLDYTGITDQYVHEMGVFSRKYTGFARNQQNGWQICQ